MFSGVLVCLAHHPKEADFTPESRSPYCFPVSGHELGEQADIGDLVVVVVFGDLPGVERPTGVEVEVGLHWRLAFGWCWCSVATTGVGIRRGTVAVPIVIRVRPPDQEAGRRATDPVA